jgi:hypothetical protein
METCKVVDFCVDGRLCLSEAFAVVILWVVDMVCVEAFVMMGF